MKTVIFGSWYLYLFEQVNFLSITDRIEKHSTMPDSPVDVKTQSRLTPPTMPPPPTTQGAPRTSSFTPTTCKAETSLTKKNTFSKTNNIRPSLNNKNYWCFVGEIYT